MLYIFEKAIQAENLHFLERILDIIKYRGCNLSSKKIAI